MGEGLKRVAKRCGGLVVSSGSVTIAHAPLADLGLTNIIQSVNVPFGKRVNWTFTYTPAGTFVSGYTLVKELP